jgi:hypothetical protein
VKREHHLMSVLDKVYKKSDSIVFRKIADEFILVPIRQNVGDLESISTLNEVAARIWELIDGKKRVREIKDVILDEYEVTPKKLEADIIKYIKDLENIGAIQVK